MRPFAAALLDVDGTLVDSNEAHVEVWHTAFAERGLTISRNLIRKQIGKGADMLVPTLAPQLNEQEQKAVGERQGTLFKSHYLELINAFPGAHQLIELLARRGIKVVLASSSGESEIEHYIELLDVRDMIYAVTSRDEVAHTKPAPDIFSQALKKVAPLDSLDVIAVGDTPYDAIAATRCGIYAVGLRTGGFSDTELNRAGAQIIYDSVAELHAVLNTSPVFPPR